MSLNDRDPEKLRAWRERGARNYQEKRRQNPGKGLSAVSKRRADQNRLRRAVVRDMWPERPRCALCEPLREHGIVTGCDGWADDVDEILRRSAGGSIVDMENLRPVGRACHRWGTEHPAAMRSWGLERSRWGVA